MKAATTWVLIANGAKARIVENTGAGSGLSLVDNMVFADNTDSVSEIMADKPGRVHDSAGAGRHAMEYASDPVREREKHFAKTLTEVLENGYDLGKFDRLIVVAAPQTLGDLRTQFEPKLKKLVAAEIDKDLTMIPNAQLIQQLEQVVPV